MLSIVGKIFSIHHFEILCPLTLCEGHIVFGADLVGVCISTVVGIGITLSCLYDIL